MNWNEPVHYLPMLDFLDAFLFKYSIITSATYLYLTLVLKFKSTNTEINIQSTDTSQSTSWRCSNGCISWSFLRTEESWASRTGFFMHNSSSRGYQGCAGHTGAISTNSVGCCSCICPRQRPINEKGGMAYPLHWLQSRLNASVPRSSGSGFQLTNFWELFGQSSGKKYISRGA